MTASTFSRRRIIQAGLATLALPIGFAAAAQKPRTLSDGSFTLPLSMLARGRDEAELQAVLAGAGWPTDQAQSVLNVTVLQHDKGYALFDCGAGPNFMAGAGQLPKALAEAGIDVNAVTDVILTHAHPDHLWGGLDEFDEPLCPKARYHIGKAELDYWRSPDIYSTLPEERHAFAAGAQRVLKGLDKVLQPFEAGAEIVSGVFAISTRGHTSGHMSFAIQQGSETTYVLGDALTHAILSFARPEWAGGMDHLPEEAVITRKSLLDRLTQEKARFIGYHLPKGGIGRAERDGFVYRFVGES